MADNVIELVVKVVNEATEPLKNIVGGFDSIVRSITGLSIGGVASIAGVVAAAKLMIEETSRMEDATIRLDRTYKAFSDTLNVSRASLTRFAETAQQTTRFSAAEVTEAQKTLIQFGSVTGTQLQEAQQVMLDLAEQMGGNLSSAAMVLSRALTNPLQSARLLRQAGVELTDQEKDQIKTWEDMDQHGEAVALILDKLKERTSGAAQSALNTYSGSWDHLKNTLKELANQPEILKLITGGINAASGRVEEAWGLGSTESRLESAKKSLIAMYADVAKARELGQDRIAAKEQAHINDQEKLVKALQVRLWTEQEIKKTEERDTAKSEAGKLDEIIVVGDAKKALAEYQAQLDELEKDRIEYADVVKRADEETMTSLEKEKAAAAAFKDKLDLLLATGMPIDEYNKRMKEFDDTILHEFIPTVDYATKKIKEPIDAATLQHIEMVKNMQNAFADMFNHIDGGIRGMLSAFLNALKQMVIQAEAARLTEAIFGKIDSKTGAVSGGSSWGTAIASIFGKILGFAEGGTVPGGSPVLVGEHGPELAFFPGGTQIMNQNQLAAAGGGGINYAPVTTFLMQPKDGDAQSLRTEFYAAMQRNNQRTRDDIFYTLNRNGFGRLR